MPVTKSYGSWTSPVSAAMLVSKGAKLQDAWVTADDAVYWLESRPREAGRFVIMRWDPDSDSGVEINPAPFYARTRVHEYGGAPVAVVGDTVYFSHYKDHRLYQAKPGSAPEPLTPAAKMRYADLVWDSARSRLIGVREDHRESDIFAVNTLVAIDPAQPDTGTILAEGYDFFMAPRVSPDGTKLAWVSWNHPNMPWDGTELWVGTFGADGRLADARLVAGGMEESVVQPLWAPDNTLHFISDRTGWWNLYRLKGDQIEAILPMEAEFSGPAWQLGLATYAFAGGDIVAIVAQNGTDQLLRINPDTREVQRLGESYAVFRNVTANAGRLVTIAASPTQSPVVLSYDLGTHTETVVKSAGERPLADADISIPEAVEFPTERGLTAHAWYYAPKNQGFQAPAGEKPPLIVFSHGGPTGQSFPVFSLALQYWTTRGFAVVDVNYGGSAGYGRAYRNRLYGNWGLNDVEDCTNAALYLADQGLADPKRLAIRGGSAGGYTTLACLTFRDVFAAGASYYGVSDLGALARETHKFESRYLDRMIGPYPEDKAVYDARSPLMHADQITNPIIFFQGLDDKIVLPNQAEEMVDQLKQNHIPVAYIPFDGEGHGFVQADTIIRAQEAELYFYAQIMGIPLEEAIDPVAIWNWPNKSQD